MRVFVTGATGFIGAAVTEELMAAGHTVTALARSEEAAKKLSAKGIQPILGNLDDMESLRKAAAAADGVIHLAFMHGPSQIPFVKRMGVIFGGLPSGIAGGFMAVASEADRRAIDTFGAALRGSGRPLVTTFGTMGLSHVGFRAAKPATEEDEPDPLSAGIARAKTEENVEALASLGVRATMIRLAPSVHGDGDTGLGAPAHCDRPQEGPLCLCRRRSKSLACRASAGCGATLPAGARKGCCGNSVSRCGR